MSTRATVWIKNEDTGEERFLYHHCDGYDLDGEISDVLSGLRIYEWEVENIAQAIIDYDCAYGTHHVDGIGWDSEYVYVISIKDRTLSKYECGFEDPDKKTRPKYLVRQVEFGLSGGVASETMPFGDPEEEAKRKTEKIKDLVENMKRLMDWAAGTLGLGEEERKTAAKKLYEMYNGNNCL